MQHIIRFFGLFFCFFITVYGEEPVKLLTPEEAFVISTNQTNQVVTFQIKIHQGVYLYDDKFKLEMIAPKKVDLTSFMKKPEAEFYHNTQTQRKSFEFTLSPELLTTYVQKGKFTLKLSYQGCADVGICYQPLSREFSFNSDGSLLDSEQDLIAQTLAHGNSAFVLLSFFGFGLLLALTPCVFPMVPILSSIIVSQPNVSMNAKKGFWLSLVYVLAMSLAYTIAGILAALFGSNLQASMQNPWIIALFSTLFIVLACSMFGFYEIRMPHFIQNRLHKASGEMQMHGVIGIAVMGFLSALIVGPCVAAPLAGALIYIGQSGDVLLGGSALFVMSLGMGVPLLLVGTTAGKYMPRPGLWMRNVNALFGMMLLGVAIWMLSRIISAPWSMAFWTLLMVIAPIYFGVLESLGEHARGWQKIIKALLFLVLIYGISLSVGFLSGSTNPLSPFEKFTKQTNEKGSQQASNRTFAKIKNLNDLNDALQKNKSEIVMVDFYADWCVNCVEFEQFTFNDPRVQAKFKNMVLLKADVTSNSDDDKMLQKSFGIYGPPAILFFKEGEEIASMRLIGFKNADEFLAHLEKIGF